MTDNPSKDEPLLGEYSWARETFPGVQAVVRKLSRRKFSSDSERRDSVLQTLVELIQEAPRETFLLPHVLDYIQRVRDAELAKELTVPTFEFWLNQFSGLSSEINERIRGKIAGKYLPREEYQQTFPVGMGRRLSGSHYVTAHHPPDLDTGVASFWGWLDAFAARIAKSLHWWNLPGQEVPSQMSRLFGNLFGQSLFALVPSRQQELTVTALDLVRQKGLERRRGATRTSTIDHGRHDKLVILVDEGGHYRGSWRTADVERFRLSTLLVSNGWRWLENRIHVGLLEQLAASEVTQKRVQAFLDDLLQQPFEDTSVIQELSRQYQRIFVAVLKEVFGIEQGLSASYADLISALGAMHLDGFAHLQTRLTDLAKHLFDSDGSLTNDQGRLFGALAELQKALRTTQEELRSHLDRLDTAILIKHRVFGEELHYVTPNAELEEIRKVLGPFQFIPVVDPENGLVPLGVIHISDLQRRVLGTVSLRDFCNREEVKIAPHFEIVSVVDHHRSSLQTAAAPTVLVADVQSCNVLLAEQAFALNDRYSLGGMTGEEVDKLRMPANPRLAQRIALRRLARLSRSSYFVHPKREFAEYLSFLYAILDDTDLLTRVSARDVRCVASLLNRLKSLMVGEEVECIELDDLPRGPSFARQAARRILENHDMYSLYSRIYSHREKEVELDLTRCAEGAPSMVFSDTKEQKGCARVGQVKIFPNNFPWFLQHLPTFRRHWLEAAIEAHRQSPELVLHIQMITTIAGAEEVFTGKVGDYDHADEMWLWVPPTEEGYQQLASYLNSFGQAPEITRLDLDVHLLGPKPKPLQEVFEDQLSDAQFEVVENSGLKHPIAVVRFDAAAITSRKLSITPHIPTIES